jgi:16S rRNA (uracil1498-N3)-methyltransferase
MRLHRFYIEQKVGEQKEITLSDHDLIHQLLNVFRLRDGSEIIIFDGSGFEYVSQIISISKKGLVLEIISTSSKPQPTQKVALYLALIKKGNFELAVEKATELGVTEIHPIISERSEKKGINMERLQKIVKEASEQSGRVILPLIYPQLTLETVVSQQKSQNEVPVVFHIDPDSSAAPNPSLSKERKGSGVAAFVGPEGGWTEKEIALFKENNFEFRSLGQNILRAETAAVVVVWEVLKCGNMFI